MKKPQSPITVCQQLKADKQSAVKNMKFIAAEIEGRTVLSVGHTLQRDASVIPNSLTVKSVNYWQFDSEL